MRGAKPLLRFGAVFLSLAVAAAAHAAAKFPQEGIWRGEFTVDGDPIPFNFEVKGTDAKDAKFSLINGSRRDNFVVERVSEDTLSVPMNTYDAALVFTVVDGKTLRGEYRDLVPHRQGARNIPFVAEHGKAWRFVEPGQDVAAGADLSGKWAVQQLDKSARADKRDQVALLDQDGNHLGGVFMTVVGDTRELEGTVQGNRFWLSHFSGPSPRLIKGTIDEDGNIQGAFGSGIYNVVRFEGRKDANVELPDPYQLTFLKDGQKTIDFTFPDLQGQPVSLRDDKYQGKVVIVEVIGTWCPNCTDQTYFLSPWFKQNRHRGVEAVAVAFEQEDSFAYFQKVLGKFKQYFDIEYDIVFGGLADKKVATEKLRGLNYMAAFPTTIIIDRKGEVREIYTGYTGTVTGEYYAQYVAKFNALLDELLAEPDPYARTAQDAGGADGVDAPPRLAAAH
ncbi:alkyl hydroperoxide reductase [Pseudoxanthomonas broegbernensis]|uniref:Alkyl hydroperoxide reductase n=1 Tax=Pseudoxanthomonas broegbernensis TaxID=83619 RepID=A0A7V8GNG2_9GAMM|nr:TlpA disulfide reductase family protein [Pseudoxanthomonas broegbernensis]KAF1686982.1 alkyl hydroperoxide reductase [Pseudoxanthomonas broegbernensis]MBB6065406.1 peroxiredoxin [Pseudoxanthomonas broegbernensis]